MRGLKKIDTSVILVWLLSLKSADCRRVFMAGLVAAALLVPAQTPSVFSEPTSSLLESTADEYRRLGYEAQKKGRWDEALRYYEKVVALGHRHPKIYNDLGVLHEMMGQPQRALWYYEEALRLDPNYLPAYTNLAYFYKDRGDVATALKYFKKRLSLSRPDDPWADKIRAEIAAILDPNDRQKQFSISETLIRLERQRQQEARLDRIRAFSEQIAQARALYAQGLRLMERKNYDEALKMFEAAARLNPDDPAVKEARRRAEKERTIEWIRHQTQEAVSRLESGDTHDAQRKFQDILTILKSDATSSD